MGSTDLVSVSCSKESLRGRPVVKVGGVGEGGTEEGKLDQRFLPVFLSETEVAYLPYSLDRIRMTVFIRRDTIYFYLRANGSQDKHLLPCLVTRAFHRHTQKEKVIGRMTLSETCCDQCMKVSITTFVFLSSFSGFRSN